MLSPGTRGHNRRHVDRSYAAPLLIRVDCLPSRRLRFRHWHRHRQSARRTLMKRVVIQRRERVYDGFFKLDETHLSYERFDGTMSEPVSRLALERGDSAAVLLYRPESRQIVLVNQFRYPTYEKGPGWIVETLAGVVDPGEDPEDAARREVLEESGYALRDLVHLSTF